MIAEPRVYAGQGAQTLRFVPVDKQGRPARVTSATYSIVDVRKSEDATDRTVATGTAVLQAVTTTLSAAAGAGTADTKRLQVASASGFTVGRAYLLANLSGRHRNVVVVAGVTGSDIYTIHSVGGVYASADTLQSIELEATFPLAEANDPEAIDEGRRYQVTWSYTLEGESYLTPQLVQLLRYSGEAWITEADVLRVYPPIADRARNRFSITDAITVATEDLAVELESSGQVPEQYRTSRTGLNAIRFRAVAYLLRWTKDEGDLALAMEFDTRWERLVRTLIGPNPGRAVKLHQGSDAATDPAINGLFKKS